MLVTREMAVGSHAWIFREGDAFTVPEAGTANANSLPGAEDAGWISTGNIEDWEDSITDEEEKAVWTPTPGHLVMSRLITTKQGMQFKFTTNQLTPIAIESFYRTDTKLDEDGYQFNPLSRVPRSVWLKIQRYSEEDNLVLAMDVFVQLKASGGMKGGGGNLIMPEFTAKLLYSPLNTMAMGSAPE